MREQARTVLLVEDHDLTREFVADNLTADGYEVVLARTAAGGLREATYARPDVVVLDLGLPDGDGLEVLRGVRGAACAGGPVADPGLPVLVLSGRAGELDRLRGFASGCDDYLVKPFSYQELRARIDALLRRTRRVPVAQRIAVGPLLVDPLARQAFLRGEPLALSGKEFDLLAALVREPYRAFTRAELLHDVWGLPHGLESRTLDAHAFRLRRKLGRDGDRFVLNVYGIGYRLAEGELG